MANNGTISRKREYPDEKQPSESREEIPKLLHGNSPRQSWSATNEINKKSHQRINEKFKKKEDAEGWQDEQAAGYEENYEYSETIATRLEAVQRKISDEIG